MANMRILVITQIIDKHDPGLGFFHRWLEVFANECESVQALCLKEGTHALPSNVTVTSLGKEKGHSRLKYLWRFYRTIFVLRHEYDAVFVHMNPEYVVLGGIVWRLMGKTVGMWYAHRTVNLKLRVAAILMHQGFTGSKESFRIPSKKILVTGQGVDTSIFIPRERIHDNTLSLLVVGRLSPIKNLELAIETLSEVRKTTHAVLRIVGAIGKPEDAAYEQKIKTMITENGLDDVALMVGGKDPDGVLDELQNADVFLHTSNTNSADKTIVEAMAVGCYVVSSSPVYAKDLPDSCIQPSDALAYAREIARFGALPTIEKDRVASVLREAAIREHSLERLVRLIVHTLQSR